MKRHLAIFKKGAGERILDGTKKIETRFSKMKLAPFLQISAGDLVYIKPTGKDIIGQFRVKKVHFYDGLDMDEIKEIKLKYGEKIVADEEYWQRKNGSKYASLIFIGQTTPFITSPIKINKRDLRGWVVLP